MPKSSRSSTTKHTKRFRRSEAAFSSALFRLMRKSRGRITVTALADGARLSRQAFYLHHHDVNAAVVEAEEDMLQEFGAFLTRRYPDDGNHNNNRRLITACFIFMSRHKDIFCEIAQDMAYERLVYRMLETLYPRLQIIWLPKGIPAPTLGSERIDHLLRSATGIICRWVAEDCCDIGKANRHIRHILQLTEEAGRMRLL